MARGQFAVLIDDEGADAIGDLAGALRELSTNLDARFREMQTLSTVPEQINSGLLVDDVCDHIYDAFRDLLPYDRIGVALLEDEGRTVRSRWARAEYAALRIGRGFSANVLGSSLAAIIETGEPRILNDLEAHLADHPDSTSTWLMVAEGIRSSLTCPLIAEKRPVGFVFFSSRQKGTYREAHVGRYLRLAGQLSVIVEKSRLYEEVVALSETKSRYLGMAAHDLRGPLAVVSGYLELVSREPALADAPHARQFLARAQHGCTTMLRLVEELLDTHAIEQGRVEVALCDLSLASWLRELVEEHGMLAEAKAIGVELVVEGALPLVRADPLRLSQIMGNLIGNALKFSEPGTTVTVTARARGQAVEIAVADQGPGIPADEQTQLFTDFGLTSVRPTGGEMSSGLGLAIVKRLVEAHEGEVGVTSQVGAGSTFTVRLPAVE